jgi:predicted ATPase
MLYKIREAFPEIDDYLEISSQTLWWGKNIGFRLDLDQFQAAVAQTDLTGSSTDKDAHRQGLMDVVNIYQGDLLPSCYDDWIIPDREQLGQDYLRILDELVEILEMDQDYDQASMYAQKLIRQDPLSELFYQRLITIYQKKGDKARAVRTYHQCVEILEKEMGLDPSPETMKLYRQLMEREIREVKPPRVTEKKTRLVGREREWDKLQNAWLVHQSGGHLVTLLGEAGIGKSYLIEEFLRWAKKGGITCLRTRSYPTDDELAFSPVTNLLKNESVQKKLIRLDQAWIIELARLVPELREQFPDLPDPEKISEGWKRRRMFDASAQALLRGESRLVIVLDDLQWCDPDTLDWLRFILEYDTDIKFLVICGVRTEDLLAGNPLIQLFGELSANQCITEILLNRLDYESTAYLAADLWGESLEKRALERLYQETEGNPLFVSEMVRAGFLKDYGDGSDLSRMPPRVQAVIETRINALTPETRDLASLAAVIGRGFDFELLFQTGEDREEDLLKGLDELWSRRLIRDEGEAGYNFSHDKFREVLYQELSPHRRVHYHKKVAQALEKIYQDQLDSAAPQLAFQFHQAGDKNRALDYYLLAGDQARMVYAQQEALEYYQSGIELQGKRQDLRSIHLFSGLGNALLKLARYEESAQAYQEMIECSRASKSSKEEAQALLALSKVQDRQGEHQEALESAQKAEHIAHKNGYQAELANAILMKGQQFYRLGEVEQAESIIKEALDLHQKRDDPAAVGRSLNLMGLIQDVKGDFSAARDLKQRALSIFNEINDPQAQWWAANITHNLAISYDLQGEYEKAISLYEESMSLMDQFGDLDWKILCLFSLGAAQVGLGDYEQAEDNLGLVLELTDGSSWIGLSVTYYYLAESYLGQDQLKYALKSALEAWDLAQKSGAQEHQGAAWRAVGKVASQLGEKVQIEGKSYLAKESFQNSRDIFEAIGAEGEKAYTLRAWAEHELERGDKNKGGELWKEAKQIFQKLDMIKEVERMKSIEDGIN